MKKQKNIGYSFCIIAIFLMILLAIYQSFLILVVGCIFAAFGQLLISFSKEEREKRKEKWEKTITTRVKQRLEKKERKDGSE